MKQTAMVFLLALLAPVAAVGAERASGVVTASATTVDPSGDALKQAMQEILRHYYNVKVTMQYCASRFDDKQMDLKATQSRWVERHSNIVDAARGVILANQFAPSPNALDDYLMAQIKPSLTAIQRDSSTEQKLHCFDTMIGIEEGAIDIANKYKEEYELLRSL